MRVSREGIDEIKRRNDLAEVVTEHGIELKRRGKTLFGLCPFHEEKTASFAVSREAGLFHCFGCGVGGDVIGFVVRFHQVSFPEALKRLADRAGLTHILQDGVRHPERASSGQASEGSRDPSGHVQGGGPQGDVALGGLRQAMAQRLHEKAATRYARFAARGGRP
jgi:DNA primase catalytic core